MIHGGLKAECESCFGLCCTALYFSASEGFPSDKESGQPCQNLQENFRCAVHDSLGEKGYKGRIAYECFGAGQKVAQVSFGGQDWRKSSETAERMFAVFHIMRQLHEFLWYLAEALSLESASPIHNELRHLLDETEYLTRLSPDALLELDISLHRVKVNALLLKTSEQVRSEVRKGVKTSSKRHKTLGRGLDFIGRDLRGIHLSGESLRGAYLIAADLRGMDLTGTDFIGADFRDADIRGADLSRSLFLTQVQINTAKGDSSTKLPPTLSRPAHWETI